MASVEIEKEPTIESVAVANEAEIEKSKGNEAFKASQFDVALDHYSKSIALDPKNPLYYANRAMAYLKLSRFSEAYDDCCISLDLGLNECKVYMRRATALESMGRLTEALRDYERAADIEQRNSQAKAAIDSIQKKISLLRETPKTRIVVREVLEFQAPEKESHDSAPRTTEVHRESESVSSNVDLNSGESMKLEGESRQEISKPHEEPKKLEEPKKIEEPKKTQEPKKIEESKKD
eukprot:TRINITY_DN5508_c0_g2_i2.p1 TRINITY_DN5508_c0_g2~~TRINITY_DN5508_c0_g2_i2.p1  ORF type:complete len:236 (-),score=61.50 TRINITY_DN5508_c0_g2_i2:102-809(-)